MVLVGSLTGGIVLAAALIGLSAGIRIQDLMRDPNSVMGAPVYVGILSPTSAFCSGRRQQPSVSSLRMRWARR